MTRVLVADDDPLISHLVCALVRTRGWEGVPVGDAEQVHAAAEAPGARYDLVVLDLQMPGASGLDTLDRLKRSPVGAAPVLVLSGSIEPGMAESAVARGAAAYLAKPFTPIGLLSALDRLLAPR